MSKFDLWSTVNAFAGRWEIHYPDYRAVLADPHGFAAAVQEHVLDRGIPFGLVVVPAAVAPALVALPGFSAARTDWDYVRPWPSGVGAPDRTGLRAVTPDDTHTICRIINSSLGEPYGEVVSPGQVRDEVFQPNWFNAILTVDGQDIAYGNAIHDRKVGTIGWLAVLPPWQRQGLGRRLFQILLAELDTVAHDQLTLVVEESNLTAIRLYESFEFARTDDPAAHVEYRAS